MMNCRTIWNRRLQPAAALLACLSSGCVATKLVTIPDGAPLRLAENVAAHVEYDAGAPPTPGHPHVEAWTRAPNKVTLHTGQYVITRRVGTPPDTRKSE